MMIARRRECTPAGKEHDDIHEEFPDKFSNGSLGGDEVDEKLDGADQLSEETVGEGDRLGEEENVGAVDWLGEDEMGAGDWLGDADEVGAADWLGGEEVGAGDWLGEDVESNAVGSSS
ncbi:hypothetical protein CYMTET_22169 [Cymbomonas tetramitiformis]|uniref:Uncharacterized protein n=1 Tax=Cymbomonas tetramitiformis TaxID=36881 RepID=A0AAE0L2G6_9CHLO|nr:hypothetical protein CYMTET_22169 [Cymbomonas tetramitiformis]